MTQYYDEAAEWRLLGSISAHPDNYKYAVMCRPAIFTDERKAIHSAMKESYLKFGVVNGDAIEATLGYIPGELDVAGAVPVRPIIANLERLARKRRYKEIATMMNNQSEAFEPDERAIHEAIRAEPIDTAVDGDLTVGVQEVLGTIRQKKTGDYRFCRTGLTFLDSRLGGEWRPGSLTLLLGDSGHGKTALALNSMFRMANNVDKHTGELDPIPSMLVSLEMKKADLVSRWVADMCSIDYRRILEGDRLTDDECAKIEEATSTIQTLPMYVVDQEDLEFEKIIESIRDYAEKGVRAVFVDYLQIVNYEKDGARLDYGHIAKVLKATARELDIAIILLSQVNAENEGQNRVYESRKPVHHADTIIEIILDEQQALDPKRSGHLHAYKNRFGPLGKAVITFTGMYQRFDNYKEDDET